MADTRKGGCVTSVAASAMTGPILARRANLRATANSILLLHPNFRNYCSIMRLSNRSDEKRDACSYRVMTTSLISLVSLFKGGFTCIFNQLAERQMASPWRHNPFVIKSKLFQICCQQNECIRSIQTEINLFTVILNKATVRTCP